MGPSSVTAFCPGHISGYFRPVLTDKNLTSGSTGAGVVIDSGVTVMVRAAGISSVAVYQEISHRKKPVLIASESPVIIQLLNNLGVTAVVDTCCVLPLSAGYGLSAAALLATVHAVNHFYSLSLSDRECAAHAHAVEVAYRTGLGDVSACQGGGWVFRAAPGPDAEILRHQDHRVIHALTLGPLKTVSVLSSPRIMECVLQAFPEGKPEKLEDFFRLSRLFAEGSGLISDEIRKVLIACDANDIPASMTMLGNGVFALGNGAAEVLNRFGTVYSLHIAENGPRILETVS